MHVRENGWLSGHDLLKVGLEYQAVASGLESLRILLGIAINGTLLSRAGDRDVLRHLDSEGFEIDERLGFTVLVPSEQRMIAAVKGGQIDVELHQLDRKLAALLGERGLIPCVGVVDVSSVSLDSPIRVLTSIFASVRDGVIDADKKVFPVAEKVVVYGTLLTMIFNLASCTIEPSSHVEAQPPSIGITIPGTNIDLGSQYDAWLKRLQSQNESERTTAQQKALHIAGIDAGPIDGMDGPRTRDARNKFAKLHGLENWDSDPKNLARLLAMTASTGEFLLPTKNS